MGPTEEQRAVIEHGYGPARLLAGPGTGKSYTLARRVEALVASGVDPGRMLLISFTRLSAAELAEGVASADLGDREPPATSTLHGYAFRQLRLHSGQAYVGRYVIDDWEQNHLIRVDLGRRVGLSPGRVSELLHEYDAAWRTLTLPPSFPEQKAFEAEIENLRRALRFVLQGELVEKFRQMLDGNPEFDPGIDYLIVDEYQDLNRCDQEVIQRLSSHGAHLLVAGDDDQSLYAFRHANPDGIVGFTHEHAPCGDYRLTECRRCPDEIVKPALRLIECNPGRATKELRSPRVGGEVHVYSFAGQRKQAQGVAEIVQRELEAGTVGDKVFILLPRKGFASLYLDELSKAHISAVDLANSSQLFDEIGIRRVIYLLRYVADPDDVMAIRGWFATTPGLGPGRVGWVLDLAITENRPLADCVSRCGVPQVVAAHEDLVRLAADLSADASPLEAASKAMGAVGLEDALQASLLEVIQLLAGPDDGLGTVLARLHEYREQPAVDADGQKPVRLMTLYGAKGLTADVAIITDAEDEIIPGAEDVVEQRRLMYVSMTRARERLYITHARFRSGATGYAGTGAQSPGPERQRSRFLNDAGLKSERLP